MARAAGNIMQLWQELKERGFQGQALTVRSWLRQRFGSAKKALIGPSVNRSPPASPQRIARRRHKGGLMLRRYESSYFALGSVGRELISKSCGRPTCFAL